MPELPRLVQPVETHSEAERTLKSVADRARIDIAIAVATAVVVVRQIGGLPDDVVARGFVVAAALAASVLAHDVPARLGKRRLGAPLGVVADVVATLIPVAMLVPALPLAPALFLWPLFTAGASAGRAYVVPSAALSSVAVLAIALLTGEPSPLADIAYAAGWALLFVTGALAYLWISRQLHEAHRAAEDAMRQAAAVADVGSAAEVAMVLFEFLDRLLGTRGHAAAVLHDERGDGVFVALAARGIDADARAALRLRADASRAVGVARDQGVWFETERVADEIGLTGAFRTSPRVFLLPLRDVLRLSGFAVVAAERERRIGTDTRRSLASVSAQVASALHRLHSARRLEQRQAAISFLFAARGAEGDVRAIARVTERTALEATGADSAWLVGRDASGEYWRLGGDTAPADLTPVSRLVEWAYSSERPVVIGDASADPRFRTAGVLGEGSIGVVLVDGTALALVVHHAMRDRFGPREVELLRTLAEQVGPVIARADVRGAEAPQMRAHVVQALRAAVESQPFLAGSGDRAAGLAVRLCEQLGVPMETRHAMYVASLLRDIGELGIDHALFERAGPLDELEMAIVRQHPAIGEALLAGIPQLRASGAIVRAHHERFDGGGYPDGVAGEDIPIGARVLAVADAFTAMTADRPYRAALSAAEALEELRSESGSRYDPAVVRALAALALAPAGADAPAALPFRH